MTEKFYGPWYLEVFENVAGASGRQGLTVSQRFRISGSDSSDGSYLWMPAETMGTPAMTIARVSGKEWFLTMEWNVNPSFGWHPSRVWRTPSYTVRKGLVIRLDATLDQTSVDPTVAMEVESELQGKDFLFDGVTIYCKSLDPTINPLPPSRIPFDFTIPEKAIVKKKSAK